MSTKVSARLIGALFLAGFLAYGVGFSLVTSVTGTPDFLSTISANQTTLVFGAFLMFLNTGIDLGKGVLFFPILEGHGKRTALVYLAAISVQVVLLDLGVLLILMHVPLAELAAEASGPMLEWATALGLLLTDSSTLAYNMGQAVLSFGGVFLCWLLYRARLIPRALAALGVIGYVLHGAGSIAEFSGIPISLFTLIPGAIFELGLAFWLLIKGFETRPKVRDRNAPAASTETA